MARNKMISMLWPALLLLSGGAAIAVESLDDESLQAISGGQGIAFSMSFRINANADGSTVGAADCPTVGALSGGASCRLALSLADRDGMWIVMKSYRGQVNLKNIRVDAVNLGSNWSPHAGASLQSSNLCTAWSGASCTTYFDPRSKPAIQLTAGAWAVANAAGSSSYTAYLNQAIYNDLTMSLDVDRLSAEFDVGTTPGYLLDNVSGAPIRLRIGDTFNSGTGLPTGPAQVRLDGRLQVFGY